MRIERHNDTVSFDGGTMSRTDALQSRPTRELRPSRVHGGSELDRHAAANAALAATYRRVYIR